MWNLSPLALQSLQCHFPKLNEALCLAVAVIEDSSGFLFEAMPFLFDANLSRRQLETYSRGRLILKLKKIFRELGKKRMSEAGAKHGELYKDLGRLSITFIN